MAIAITKMSQNGQVVIPADIRQDAHLNPAVKFLVFNEGSDILLKHIREEDLIRDLDLIRRIEESEEQFAKGECVEVDSSDSVEEIDRKLSKGK